MPARPKADGYPLKRLSHRSSPISGSMPRLTDENGSGDTSAFGRLVNKKTKERLSDVEVEDEDEGESAALLGGQAVLDSDDGSLVSSVFDSLDRADKRTVSRLQHARIEEQKCWVENQFPNDPLTTWL